MSNSDNVVFEFARVESRDEIVVYLSKLADPMPLHQLADLFILPRKFILDSLGLPRNEAIQRKMYDAVREIYRPPTSDDYGMFVDLDDPAAPAEPPNDPDGPVLPPSDGLERWELTLYLLKAYDAGSGDNDGEPAWRWELPRMDLVLTRTEHLTRLLRGLYARGPRRAGIESVVRVDQNAGAIAALEAGVKKLEEAARVRSDTIGGGKSAMEVVGGVTMVRSLLNLQARHWVDEHEAGRITSGRLESHINALGVVDQNVESLAEDAMKRRAEEIERGEGPAADALLELLRDDKLARLIEFAFTSPEFFERSELERIFNACEKAATLLAQSVRFERFVDEHVVDMLIHGAKDLTRDAQFEIDQLDEDDRSVVTDGYAAALEALRTGAAAEDPNRYARGRESCLRWLALGIRGYRLGLSAVSAILEEGVVARTFYLLRTGFGSSSTAVQSASRGLAVILLRGLANNAVAHRHTIANEEFVMGGALFRKMAKTLRGIEKDALAAKAAGKPVEWDRLGKRMKDLQVRPVPRSVMGARIRRNVSIAAVLLAVQSAMDDMTVDDVLVLASSLLNLAEHSLRLGEIASGGNISTFFSPPDEVRQKKPLGRAKKFFMSPVRGTNHPGSSTTDTRYSRFDRGMKVLAGSAAGLTAWASYRRLKGGSLGRQREVLEVLSLSSNASVAIGQFMMGPFAGRTAFNLAAGAYLNMAGVAIGVVVFLAQIYVEIVVVKGTLPVLRQMLKHIETMPANKNQSDVFSDLQWWLDTHEVAFSVLGDRAEKTRGERTDAIWVGTPTWWKAGKMGFSPAAIAVMFDAGHVDVEATLVGLSQSAEGDGA